MKMKAICFLICGALLTQHCTAQTNVTGVTVDAAGNPIAGVRCCVSGFPQPSGGRNIYSGIQNFVFTDKEGHFSIQLPRGDPLVDLQFDGGGHAPLFLYNPPTLSAHAKLFTSLVEAWTETKACVNGSEF